MLFRTCLRVSIACMFVVLSLPSLSFAETPEISASDGGLSIEEWELIMPEVIFDKKTGKTWVKYNHPDGSYQSYTLSPGEGITPKWAKKGISGFSTTPSGYSIEDTENVVNWWANGGRGDYRFEEGQWVPISKQPVQQQQPVEQDTGSTPQQFGNTTVIPQPVETNSEPNKSEIMKEYIDAKAAYDELRKKNPREYPENYKTIVERYQKAYEAYKESMK